jgi:thymidine phosphorylase
MTLTEKLTAYEHGDMTEEETIAFFQEMLDTGLVWELQGHYGRTAGYLLDLGVIK